MNPKCTARRQYWSWVAGWVGCIYLTLYIVRPVFDYLDSVLPVDLAVNAFIVLILVILAVSQWRKGTLRNASSWIMLAAVLGCYGYGLMTLRLPAEKVHFIQYGVLGHLCYRALRIDWSRTWSFPLALLLAFMFGWIDEGIQNLLPNRYYEFRDVLLNGWSAFLGLCLTFIFMKDPRRQIKP